MIGISGGYFVEIDDEDLPLVAQHTWYYAKSGTTVYARAEVDGETIAMHRLIVDASDGLEVDHRDRNGLNNKRSNLRLSTRSQNRANTDYAVGEAGYRGVTRKGSRWQASIMHQGVEYYLGLHDTAEEAARVRDNKAKELHGEFAILNFKDDES
jgi:hypothetical protein